MTPIYSLTATPTPSPAPRVEEDSGSFLTTVAIAATSVAVLGSTAYYALKSRARSHEREERRPLPLQPAPRIHEMYGQSVVDMGQLLVGAVARSFFGAAPVAAPVVEEAPVIAAAAAPVAAPVAAVEATPGQRARDILNGANDQIQAIAARINAARAPFNIEYQAARVAVAAAKALVLPTAEALNDPIALIQGRFDAMQAHFTTIDTESQAMIDLVTQLEGQLPAELPADHEVRQIFRERKMEAQTARTNSTELRNEMQTSLARLRRTQESIARESEDLGTDIDAFTLNLPSLSAWTLQVFIAGSIAKFQTIHPTIIRERLNNALFERREAIAERIEVLENQGAAAALNAGRAAIAKLLDRLGALRGLAGFNGIVNASWVRAFECAKEEVRQFILVCNSHRGLPNDLPEEERLRIEAIHPQQEDSVELLKAIGERHRELLPQALRRLTCDALAATRPEMIRERFDTSVTDRKTAFMEYAGLNEELESIGGSDFNPELAYNVETGLYRVDADSRIARIQTEMTGLGTIAFLRRLLEEGLPPPAAAGGAGAAH